MKFKCKDDSHGFEVVSQDKEEVKKYAKMHMVEKDGLSPSEEDLENVIYKD